MKNNMEEAPGARNRVAQPRLRAGALGWGSAWGPPEGQTRKECMRGFICQEMAEGRRMKAKTRPRAPGPHGFWPTEDE